MKLREAYEIAKAEQKLFWINGVLNGQYYSEDVMNYVKVYGDRPCRLEQTNSDMISVTMIPEDDE